jgi:plastocyanin
VKKSVLVLVFAVAASVAACGSSTTTTGSSGSSGTSGTSGSSGSSGSSGGETDAAVAATHAVTVRSNAFIPAKLTVNVGDTVTWTWAGGNHDVVSGANCVSDGAWSSSLQSKVGATFTHTFDKAGSFEYFCTPHCQSFAMIGTIVVQ